MDGITLKGLNEEWKNKKSNYGTDAKATSSYWNDYQKALSDYGTANAGNLDFDSTSYNLYKNYVDQNASNAKDTYDAEIRANNSALNSKIELGTMKDNALKYANQQLQASGLASQGIGQSYQAGINNSYASNLTDINNQAVANKQSAYDTYQQLANENQNTLNNNLMEQAQAQKSDAFSMASNMLENATSQADIDNIKSAYYNNMSPEMQKAFDYYANAKLNSVASSNSANAYNNALAMLENATSVEDINNIENGVGANLTGNEKSMFEYYKNQVLNTLNSQDTYTGTSYGTISDLQNANYNSDKTFAQLFKNETNKLGILASQGELTDGEIIELDAGNDNTAYIQYKDGQYRVINNPDTTQIKHVLSYDKEADGKVSVSDYQTAIANKEQAVADEKAAEEQKAAQKAESEAKWKAFLGGVKTTADELTGKVKEAYNTLINSNELKAGTTAANILYKDTSNKVTDWATTTYNNAKTEKDKIVALTIENLSQNADYVEFANNFMNEFYKVQDSVRSKLSNIGEGYENSKEVIQKSIEKIQNDGLLTTYQKGLDELSKKLYEEYEKNEPKIKETGNKVKEYIDEAIKYMKEHWQEFIKFSNDGNTY